MEQKSYKVDYYSYVYKDVEKPEKSGSSLRRSTDGLVRHAEHRSENDPFIPLSNSNSGVRSLMNLHLVHVKIALQFYI